MHTSLNQSTQNTARCVFDKITQSPIEHQGTQIHMARSLLDSIDVQAALDRAAADSAEAASPELIKIATSSRAMASVQGLVGAHFYRLHLRQLPQVISLLLLQLHLLRQESSESRDHLTRTRRRLVDLESGNTSDYSRLQQRIQELMKQNAKYKAKYEELYKINQHWSLDYEVLKKQLQDAGKAVQAQPTVCRKCDLLEGEINTKSELLLDVQHSVEKLKIRNQDVEAELIEKERDIDQLKSDCDAMRLQLRDYPRLLKQGEDKAQLQHEVRVLREKCRIADSEQARLVSQITHLKETMWSMFYRADQYGSGHTTYTDGVKQRNRSASHTATALHPSLNKDHYSTPPTPPGLLSRGDLTTASGNTVLRTPDTCRGMAPYLHIDQAPVTRASSQYLETKILTLPTDIPRPLSAPGYLTHHKHSNRAASGLVVAETSQHVNGIQHQNETVSTLHENGLPTACYATSDNVSMNDHTLVGVVEHPLNHATSSHPFITASYKHLEKSAS